MAIQDIIKQRRLELGLTLKDVADALNVAESTVSRYETSYIANMKIDKLKALADVLKCTPGYLMGWNEETEFNEDVAKMLVEIKREPDFLRLAKAFRALSGEQKSSVLNLIESMAPQQKQVDYYVSDQVHPIDKKVLVEPSGKSIELRTKHDARPSLLRKDNQGHN